MGEVFDYAMTKAPADVEATLNWIVEQGATITRESGGQYESFGNVFVEFTVDDAVVSITRDRDQWELYLRVGDLPRFDFEVVHRALIGDDRWSRDSMKLLARQIPDGVSWRAELPHAIEWLRTTPDAKQQLQRLEQRRYDALLGPAADRDHPDLMR